ncbi:MAG: Nif3-like dinuclear metal center hexameric protein [Bacteroidales bacterium]|nr:Nif3-like dinuclear metal center hexameric protein [Candidatus Physcousia equi]
MKIKEIIDALEHFAPLPLQESYDNAGLQVGLTEAEASGALLCLDVTEDVVREAIDLDCNLIVAHHPLLFRGLKTVGEATQVERVVRMAIKNDICIYAAHTNLDNVEDGVNYKMAEKLGLVDVQMINPRRVKVMQGGKERTIMAGSGVMGYLMDPMDAMFFLEKVKTTFRVDCLMHNELLARPIMSVALCGGAGDFLLADALRLEADAFLTGEMHYHQYFGHEQEVQIGVLGHYQSEQFTMEILACTLEDAVPILPVFTTAINTNPIYYL